MRTAVVIVLLVALGAALLTARLGGWFGDDAAPSPGRPDEAPPAAAAAGTPDDAAAAPPQRTRASPTRAEPPPPPALPLADAPTAWLCVVDHQGDQPLAGAAVRRVQGGGDLAFTDERGLVGLPLVADEQLAVVLDGYLLRLVPTRRGSTATQPQPVRLVRDVWSLVRTCRFTTAAGEAVPLAFVRFRPQAPAASVPAPVPADDPVLVRAWSEHTMLAGRPVCADVPVQLGIWSEDRVHRLADGDAVRFVAPGSFVVEAATTSGLVARGELRLESGTGEGPMRLSFAPGGNVAGAVVDAAGAPLAGAKLVVQGGEPLGLVATTGVDGGFELGPLLPGSVTLHVRHAEHEAAAFGPVAPGGDPVRVVLRPLPRTALRGRVRARPHGRPIAGATVAWMPPGGVAVTATTDGDGSFVLSASGTSDARLVVQAQGFVPYAELVAPGAPFADYDLLPAATAARLDAGLTAMLAGVVVDAAGRPVEGASVRWQPKQRTTPGGMPGRRVLHGGVLDLSLVVASGADGAFQLETDQFGPGRLRLIDAADGVDAEATAGGTVNGLRLRR